jgi:hypothetical protein
MICPTPPSPKVRAFAALSEKAAPTADSASGGFVRQFPPLPVTPAVSHLFRELCWGDRVK